MSEWISVEKELPEIGQPVYVTCYGKVGLAVMRSKDGNYGHPVFWLYMFNRKKPHFVQETIEYNDMSKGRISAWKAIDIPEPYKGGKA